jgi:branched-subunit amino acid ABC-type transport system permease component
MIGQALGFGLITAAIIIIASLGITLQFSVTNFINFAYGTFLAVSYYAAGWLAGTAHVPFIAYAAFGVVIAAIVSYLIGRLLDVWFVKRGSPRLVILIATFGLAMIIENILLAVWGPDARTLPLAPEVANRYGPFLLTQEDLLTLAVVVVTCVALHITLKATTLGRKMRAVSDNPGLASSMGINVQRVTSTAWLMSGGLAGIAGIAFAVNIAEYTPSAPDQFLFLFFAAVIIGGVGNVYGAIVAGAILGIATEVFASLAGSTYKYSIALILLSIMILVRPQGLFPARIRL